MPDSGVPFNELPVTSSQSIFHMIDPPRNSKKIKKMLTISVIIAEAEEVLRMCVDRHLAGAADGSTVDSMRG